MKIQIPPDRKAPFDAMELAQYAKQLAAFQVSTTGCKKASINNLKCKKKK